MIENTLDQINLLDFQDDICMYHDTPILNLPGQWWINDGILGGKMDELQNIPISGFMMIHGFPVQ